MLLLFLSMNQGLCFYAMKSIIFTFKVFREPAGELKQRSPDPLNRLKG